MNYTCRTLIRISAFLLCYVGLSFGQTFIDTVKAEFQSYRGLQILFSLNQNIQGDEFEYHGRFEIFKPDSFAYENGVSVIKVTGNTVATFSPEQKHVILETYSPKMYHSLSLFTGNFNGVDIQVKNRTGQETECRLFVPEYNINGTIWFDNQSYLPKRLVFETAGMDRVSIQVDEMNEMRISELMDNYQIDSDWEILDLRE